MNNKDEVLTEITTASAPIEEIGLPSTGVGDSEAQRQFMSFPTSPAEHFMMNIFKGRKANGNVTPKTSHSTKITVKRLKNKIKYEYVSGKDSVSVTMPEPGEDKTSSKKNPIKKVFSFILMKITEQAFHGGELVRDFIEFELYELVELGIYKTLDTARRGFDTSFAQLKTFEIEGASHRGKKKISASFSDDPSASRFMFIGKDKGHGTRTIYLNTKLNWGFVIQYYTIMPRWAFSLSSRAFDLTYYIFYLARQHMKDIKENGKFTIGMRAIQAQLNIPDAKDTMNPRRDIIDAIENAITEIEEASHTKDFTITPYYKDDTATAFLNGYIEIGISGDYAISFNNLQSRIEKAIDKADRRRERIEERAAALRLISAENKQMAES